jgi:heme exporter protein C
MNDHILHHFARPANFRRLMGVLRPLSLIIMIVAFGSGVYLSLVASPTDFRQGDFVRLMYVHVPAAWLAVGIYGAMAVAAAIYLYYQHRLADLFVQSIAPIGATLTAICLMTGAIWGKPVWGTWWIWDARLTSVLILFFLYLGYLLFSRRANTPTGRDGANILILAGVINLPIIKFSVEWWNTLHQPASIRIIDPSSTIHSDMLVPLLVMTLGFVAWAIWLTLIRMESLMSGKNQ